MTSMVEKLIYVEQKLMDSIRKLIPYINIMVVSGMDVLIVIKKIQSTLSTQKQWETYMKKQQKKIKQITYAGFNRTEMLECKWLKSKDYKKVLNNPNTIVEPLIPEMPSMEVEQTPVNLKSKAKYYGILTLVLYIQLSSTLIITL